MTRKDSMIMGLMAQDAVRFTAIDARALCEKARETHGLSRVCTAALGRTLMCACMMGAQFKNEADRLSVIVKGGGAAGNIVCSVRPAPEAVLCKGYIEDPSLELPPTPAGKLDVAGAVGGTGELIVTRDLSLREPYVGHSSMVSGEIAEDFARYFTVSEQQPSLVYLGVHVAAGDGHVLSAGGLLIQPLPDCPETVLSALSDRAERLETLGSLLEKTDLETAVDQLLGGLEMRITRRITPRFRCDCSRERLSGVLLALGAKDLTELREDGGAELTCQFCNQRYFFDGAELEALIAAVEAKGT